MDEVREEQGLTYERAKPNFGILFVCKKMLMLLRLRSAAYYALRRVMRAPTNHTSAES